MKALIITFVFCLTSLTTLAADTTIVKLMQKIIDITVDRSYPYFYLLENGNSPKNTSSFFDQLMYEDPKLAAGIPLTELVNKIKVDTMSINWANYNFPRAICVDKKHLPAHSESIRIIHYMPQNTKRSIIDSLENRDEIIVLVNSKSTKRSSEKLAKKALAAYYLKWPPEKRMHFVFSKPIFSSDGNYAFISTDKGYEGGSYILKNTNGVWEIVYGVRWVS